MPWNKVFPVILNVLISLTSFAYPLLWLWANQSAQPFLTALPFILLVLWLGRFLNQKNSPKLHRSFSLLMVIFFAIIAVSRSFGTMYWYPVLMNVLMLSIFGGSLFRPQTFVEHLARLQMPDLPQAGVIYTRRVTQVWCIVFMLNILVTSVFILTQQYEYWAIFTGIISYLIIGVVMAVEWTIRQFIFKKYR